MRKTGRPDGFGDRARSLQADEAMDERINALQEQSRAPEPKLPGFARAAEAPATPFEIDQARLKGQIEAALFMTGKALQVHEVAEIVEAPVEDVELALVELMSDFSFRESSALEIDDTDGYILQVKEDYNDIVNKMMPLEISSAELRTLSAIAIKAPILQSDLIELRGSSAYEHIAGLFKRKLISKRREGRSYILNVTKNFYEYFKLLGDKKELMGLVTQAGREEAPETTDAAPDEEHLIEDAESGS